MPRVEAVLKMLRPDFNIALIAPLPSAGLSAIPGSSAERCFGAPWT
jgi:hypothetical protein